MKRFTFAIHIDIEPIKIKWAWQRLRRGYADSDLWNLDSHLAKYILPRLRAFAKIPAAGYPSRLEKPEEWRAILKKMVYSFEAFLRDDTNEGINKQKEIAEGFRLFGEWFMALWD